MPVEEIRQEEEKMKKQERANARASRKQKHQASSIYFPLEDEDEDVVMEAAPSTKGITGEGIVGCSDDSDDCQEIAVLPLLLQANDNASNVNNQPAIIQQLREQIEMLERNVVGLKKSVCRWRNRYNDVMEKMVVEKGSTMIECANDAVEHLMQSEYRFMKLSGCRSDKARKKFRTTLVSLMWENESTFYEFMRSLFVDHVKKHLRETIFHPAKILMRMDMAGGTLSMEGLEVLRMCETDGKKYVRNTIICSSADIKRCCAKVDLLTKAVVPYEHGHLEKENGGGEYVQWDPPHLLAAMISAYQLTDVAKERPVEVHIAIDGAMLSKNWNHLTAGAKQGDNAAFCPRNN